MKNKKSVVASIVLSGVLVVVGTLAYFTQTHTVDIKLKQKGLALILSKNLHLKNLIQEQLLQKRYELIIQEIML